MRGIERIRLIKVDGVIKVERLRSRGTVKRMRLLRSRLGLRGQIWLRRSERR